MLKENKIDLRKVENNLKKENSTREKTTNLKINNSRKLEDKLKSFEDNCKEVAKYTSYTRQSKFFQRVRKAYSGCFENYCWTRDEAEMKLEIFAKYFPQSEVDRIRQFAITEKDSKEKKELLKKEQIKAKQEKQK